MTASNRATLRRVHQQVGGQLTLEWALVLALVALPMYFLIRLCMALLVAHFQMVSFLETIPFP